LSRSARIALSEHERAPSAWLTRWVHLIKPGGTVLDVACGNGRNSRWLAQRGYVVTGIDRDPCCAASAAPAGCEFILADLEGAPWPVPGRTFDAVLVCNYLYRPLFASLYGALSGDGVLLYETFRDGQQAFGRPSNPAFLLRDGELLGTVPKDTCVIAFEDVIESEPAPRCVQRIVVGRGKEARPIR
jgi:SAM-dependent methyltransferase